MSNEPRNEANLRRMLRVLERRVEELDRENVSTQEADELRRLYVLARSVVLDTG